MGNSIRKDGSHRRRWQRIIRISRHNCTTIGRIHFIRKPCTPRLSIKMYISEGSHKEGLAQENNPEKDLKKSKNPEEKLFHTKIIKNRRAVDTDYQKQDLQTQIGRRDRVKLSQTIKKCKNKYFFHLHIYFSSYQYNAQLGEIPS